MSYTPEGYADPPPARRSFGGGSQRWRLEEPRKRQINMLVAVTLERFEKATREGVEDWVNGTGIFALGSTHPGIKDVDKGVKNRGDVSDKISWTLRFPKLDTVAHVQDISAPSKDLPDVPKGRYAVQGMGDDPLSEQWYFYKVDRPTKGVWAGRTFVKRGRGGGEMGRLVWDRVSRDERDRALERVVQTGIELSMKRFGQKHGQCGKCGRGLTDKTSTKIGIGPDCRRKYGIA